MNHKAGWMILGKLSIFLYKYSSRYVFTGLGVFLTVAIVLFVPEVLSSASFGERKHL